MAVLLNGHIHAEAAAQTWWSVKGTRLAWLRRFQYAIAKIAAADGVDREARRQPEVGAVDERVRRTHRERGLRATTRGGSVQHRTGPTVARKWQRLHNSLRRSRPTPSAARRSSLSN